MINEAYLVLQTIVNKEQDGYVQPSEYTQIAKLVQDSIFRSYFEDINRDQNRENRGLTNPGYGNLVQNQEERLAPFMETSTLTINTGVYTLPSDLFHIEQDGIISNTGKVIELTPHRTRGYLSGSIGAPDTTFMTCYRNGQELVVDPSTYVDDITLHYVRKPIDPLWAYTTMGNGDPLYNPSASVDFELHPSEFTNIVLHMLSYFGITIREGEVIQVAESMKGVEIQKENS